MPHVNPGALSYAQLEAALANTRDAPALTKRPGEPMRVNLENDATAATVDFLQIKTVEW